jgi:hypothetical protein
MHEMLNITGQSIHFLGVTSPLCTAHNVQLVNVYSVVNTTDYSFIA